MQLVKTEASVEEDDGIHSFDPNLGPRARNRTEQARSIEEREWVTLDKTLNPDLYNLMKLEKFGKKMTLIELQDEPTEQGLGQEGGEQMQVGQPQAQAQAGKRKKASLVDKKVRWVKSSSVCEGVLGINCFLKHQD